MSNVIIGIDNASTRVGVCVMYDKGDHYSIEEVKEWKLRGDSVGEKLGDYAQKFSRLVNLWKPSSVIIESPFARLNFKTYGQLMKFIGIIEMICFKQGIDFTQIAPTSVKKLVGGRGNSTKEEVAEAIHLLYGVDISQLTDNETDAIAIAHSLLIQEGRL